jgi:hypothetical protein
MPEITLKLPLNVVEYVLNLVNEQPRKVADPVWKLIQSQAQFQVDELNKPQVINVNELVKAQEAAPAA